MSAYLCKICNNNKKELIQSAFKHEEYDFDLIEECLIVKWISNSKEIIILVKEELERKYGDLAQIKSLLQEKSISFFDNLSYEDMLESASEKKIWKPYINYRDIINWFLNTSSYKKKILFWETDIFIENIVEDLKHLELLDAISSQLEIESEVEKSHIKNFCVAWWSIIESLVIVYLWKTTTERTQYKAILYDEVVSDQKWESWIWWSSKYLYKMMEYCRNLRNLVHNNSNIYNQRVFNNNSILIIKYVLWVILKIWNKESVPFLELEQQEEDRILKVSTNKYLNRGRPYLEELPIRNKEGYKYIMLSN